MNGSGVEQSEKYLRLVVELNMGSLSSLFGTIKKYRSVRNLIVHNNSILLFDDSKPIEEQTKYKELIISRGLLIEKDSGSITINHKDFLLDFVDTIDIFFCQLIALLQSKEKEIREPKK